MFKMNRVMALALAAVVTLTSSVWYDGNTVVYAKSSNYKLADAITADVGDTVDGKITSNGDQNYFKFTAQEDGCATFYLMPQDRDQGWKFELKDSGDHTLNKNRTTPNFDNDNGINYLMHKGDSIWIKVSAKYSAKNQEFSIQANMDAGVDVIETEPSNDTASETKDILGEYAIYGMCQDFDSKDFYKYVPEADGKVTIGFEPSFSVSPSEYTIQLTNEKGSGYKTPDGSKMYYSETTDKRVDYKNVPVKKGVPIYLKVYVNKSGSNYDALLKLYNVWVDSFEEADSSDTGNNSSNDSTTGNKTDNKDKDKDKDTSTTTNTGDSDSSYDDSEEDYEVPQCPYYDKRFDIVKFKVITKGKHKGEVYMKLRSLKGVEKSELYLNFLDGDADINDSDNGAIIETHYNVNKKMRKKYQTMGVYIYL